MNASLIRTVRQTKPFSLLRSFSRPALPNLVYRSIDTRKMSTISSKKFPEQFNHSSGVLDAVWIATEPYSAINKYKTIPNSGSPTSLDGIVVVGAGISGITVAYELVERGVRVMLVEGREILSGETGRTTGHLSSGDVGDRYYQLIDGVSLHFPP